MRRWRLGQALALAMTLAWAMPAAASSQLAPWDGNPISRGLGPTYGEDWCEPPASGSSIANQQGPPLALIPSEAIECTLDEIRAEAKAARIPKRMSYSTIGRTVRGRTIHQVVVNALETPRQRRDYERWTQLRALLLKDPERAQKRLSEWGSDVKLPILVEANVHGTEEEGTDAMMQVVRDLVTTPYGEHPDVDRLLDHAILIVHPTINPDGRAAGTRANANGFDMNRDFLVQSQPEVRTSVASQHEWLAPVGLTMHGYYNPTLVEGESKPHNPGYEFDLLVKWNQRRLDANEQALAAAGMGIQRPVNDWNRDAEIGASPFGPPFAEGWDDWGPFYSEGYMAFYAPDGSIVEMCDDGQGCDGRFGSKRAQYVAFHSSARFWIENRKAILRDQIEIFRRNVTGAKRRNCCDDPLVAERGFTEDQHNWMVEYPEAFVIPFAGDAQRSDAEANRLAQWLLDNGIELERTKQDYRWRGQTLPKDSYVVPMDQAFRGLAFTALSAGQDISDRITQLYAPPGAWSHGLLWGADVIEVPRGDSSFKPKTDSAKRVNRLEGGVRGGGRADWYSVTLKGASEVRAVLDVLRRGVSGEIAEEPFTSSTGGRMPAGTLIFPADAEKALRAAGREAGIDFERNRGVKKPETTKLEGAPKVAVLVDSASPAESDTSWSLRQIFGADVGLVSAVAGAGSLQNASDDPLLGYDVIYNAGTNFPAPANALARGRLAAFFERGGGYIATSQSSNNFAFLNDSALVEGELTQGSSSAYGGIARWENVGADGPVTGGYPDNDFLYLQTDITWFSSTPAGAQVDGRYPSTVDDLFVAGLWRNRGANAIGTPVIVHGETTVESRYLAFATNPFARGDFERAWALIGQAALWSTLTDEGRPTGTLTGTVTDASGAPVAGAAVTVTGTANRSRTTDAAGRFETNTPAGEYAVSVSAFGFVPRTVTGVVVRDGQTTVQDVALDAAPSRAVSGTVTDHDGNPLSGVSVTIRDTPLEPAVTDEAGAYRFAAVPEGEYELEADGDGCFAESTRSLTVDGDEVVDLVLERTVDGFGYSCEVVVDEDYVEAGTVVPLAGDDVSTTVELPFSFPFYGQRYSSAHIASNGYLNFEARNASYSNTGVPNSDAPNAAVYPFWDDFTMEGAATVRTETVGEAPNRRFVIEWRDVPFLDSTSPVDFEVVLYEDGRIHTNYRNLGADGREQGNSATVGVENPDGTVALQFSFNEPVLRDRRAILFRPPG